MKILYWIVGVVLFLAASFAVASYFVGTTLSPELVKALEKQRKEEKR